MSKSAFQRNPGCAARKAMRLVAITVGKLPGAARRRKKKRVSKLLTRVGGQKSLKKFVQYL
ncbi:hypothetical protein [Pseudolysobacter antarcticus]|uniref:hypothetical protein n=1 Tax=Pseudolysobacter antarcticus TaxID=2511995 RepID=UPI0010201828|nr:hypothetical protein [Pseudolysobacter antarcticus]